LPPGLNVYSVDHGPAAGEITVSFAEDHPSGKPERVFRAVLADNPGPGTPVYAKAVAYRQDPGKFFEVSSLGNGYYTLKVRNRNKPPYK
jgi:hypothetical protein